MHGSKNMLMWIYEDSLKQQDLCSCLIGGDEIIHVVSVNVKNNPGNGKASTPYRTRTSELQPMKRSRFRREVSKGESSFCLRHLESLDRLGSEEPNGFASIPHVPRFMIPTPKKPSEFRPFSIGATLFFSKLWIKIWSIYPSSTTPPRVRPKPQKPRSDCRILTQFLASR